MEKIETLEKRGGYREEKKVDQEEPLERRIQDHSNEDFVPPKGYVPIPLKHSDQGVALFNIGNVKQNPKSLTPAYRILGVFPNPDAAKAFVKQKFPKPDINFFLAPTHQLVCICKDSKYQNDANYNQEVINDITQLHTQHVAAAKADFQNALKNQSSGATKKSIGYLKSKSRDIRGKYEKYQQAQEKLKQEITALPSIDQLTSDQLLAKQKYAVVVHASDIRPNSLAGKEPFESLFAVLFVTDDAETAENYAKFTAHKEFKDCNIDVVCTQAWIFPEEVDEEKIKQEFGQKTLTDVMNRKIQSEQEAAEMEKIMEQKEKEKEKELNIIPEVD